MLQLSTLGSLDLAGPSGQSLDDILAQPKRSVLLTYLATATPRGYHRRDVLVALFWPELDADRARAALRKALHFLRNGLGDAILTRGDEVAVDTELIRCDAVEFERAESEGRLEEAMALFRGDFLNGVFLRDAPEVERWVAAERARLAMIAARGAWALADAAAANDPSLARDWAARASAASPDDEGVLRRRMTLLARIGNRAAALRAYDEFAVSLAREFAGALPSAATRELKESLMTPEPVAPPASAGSTAQPSPTQDIPTTIRPEFIAPPITERTKLNWRSSALFAAMAAVAIVVVSLASGALQNRRDMHGTSTSAHTIAVMPFTVRGERIDYLQQGMIDLLSISLNGAGDIQPVDPTALLGYLAHDSAETNISHARDVANRFGAATFTIGTIVNAQGTLEARASLYSSTSKSDSPLAVATGSADETHLATLVDDLTREIVAGMFGSRGMRLSQLAARTTTSLTALKSYLRGEQAMRTGQYEEATDAFRAATRDDSSFALAYYGLSMAVGWATEGTDRFATVAATEAVKHVRGLSQHDSLLLVAHAHAWNGATQEAEEEYRKIVSRYPTDPDAWHEYADVIFHNGSATGHALGDARNGFTRVAGIDAMKVSALTHLARIAAVEHDSLALDTLVAHARSAAPNDPRVAEIAALRTFVSGDSLERSALIGSVSTRSDRDIWFLARAVANYPADWRDAESIALLLTSSTKAVPIQALGWTMIAEFRASAGRPAAARAAIAKAQLFDPGQAAFALGNLLAMPYLAASRAQMDSARAALVQWTTTFKPLRDVDASGVLSLVLVRAPLLGAVDARLARAAPSTFSDSVESAWYAASANATRVLTRSSTDTMLARAQLHELQNGWHNVHKYVTARSEGLIALGRARLHEVLGENAEAERWYSTFPSYDCDCSAYRVQGTLGRARVQETRRNFSGAAKSYAEVAWLWRDAEPAYRAVADDAGNRGRRLQK